MGEEEKEMTIGEACKFLSQFERAFKKVQGSHKALQRAVGLESDVSTLDDKKGMLEASIAELVKEKVVMYNDLMNYKEEVKEKTKQTLDEYGSSVTSAKVTHDKKVEELKADEYNNQTSYNEMMTERQEQLKQIQLDIVRAQGELNDIQDKKAAIERLVSEVKVSI